MAPSSKATTKAPTILPHPSSSSPVAIPMTDSPTSSSNSLPVPTSKSPTVSPYPSRPSEATQYLRSLSPTKKSSSAPSHKSEQKVASGPVFLMAFLGTAVTAFIVLSVFSVSRKRRKRPAGENDHVGQDLSPMSRIENKNHNSSPENGAEEHDDCASKESSTLFPFSPMGQSLSISSTRDSWEPTPRTEKHNVMSPPPVITSENSAIEIQVSPAKVSPARTEKHNVMSPPPVITSPFQYLVPEILGEPTPTNEKHNMSPPPVITSENSAIEIQASPEKRANSRSPLRDVSVSPAKSSRSPQHRVSQHEAICYAPKGPLGLIMESSAFGPMVHSVKQFSPMVGILNPGDIIIAVDDEDTTHMDPASLAKLMMKKAKQDERKLTITQITHNK
eukprot:CAMPEP_0172434140 /NCGR_PEP_ID=MMETSP1064-20121228/70473_1 /TAXON_ID=202472 /ORGANISM="Aulacoseira subarctica , Strain CCAP 1002/5" /LENGTH=389 /DNA_ID=CAMNT_0013182339 /DNA_START=170 /DNA_END=1339 /DNA_ORIENTATION=-